MTLAEFLLARIAEDEAAAYRVQVQVPPARDEHGDWLTVPGERRPGSRRVLVECDAKRRIVESIGWHADHEANDSMINAETYASDIVRLLALPYADHDDFQEEWRPHA